MNRNRKTLGLFFCFTIVLLMASVFVYKQLTKPSLIIKQVTDNTKELNPSKIVYFNNFGEADFTCTGLTYDESDSAFWIADYGTIISGEKAEPRIIEVSNDFKLILKVLPLTSIVEENANLQGIAYDSSNSSIWLATGDYVHNINKEGNVIKSFSLGKYSRYQANGICYEEKSDTIWVLCYSKYLLNYDKSGNCLKKYKINFKDQDHICSKDGFIYATVGADYYGKDNFIVQINPDNGEVSVLYRANESYAVEGICMLGENIYVANDGLYHQAKIKNSYISIYENVTAHKK